MQNYVVTFRSCDRQGRRLAIFGRPVYNNQLEIFILQCHADDAFVKKTARDVYENYLKSFPDLQPVIEAGYHPRVFHIPLEDPAFYKRRFFNHVNETYWKKDYIMVMAMDEVVYSTYRHKSHVIRARLPIPGSKHIDQSYVFNEADVFD